MTLPQRTLKKVLTVVVLSVLALTLGVFPAWSQSGKPEPQPRPGAAAPRPADAEPGAARVAPASPTAARDIAAVQSRIAQRVRARVARESFASYLDATTGKIVVQTDAPAAVVSAVVRGVDAPVEVQRDPVVDTFNRKDDAPPFWGGAGIRNSTSICSAGFTVIRGGVRRMTTAGHCFTNGTNVLTESGARSFGTVSDRGLPSFDMELINNGSYGTSIYVGGTTSTTGQRVVGAGDPVVGFSNYCHSGRTTGEQCGHRVTSTNAQVCTSSGCKSPVIAYQGGTIIQGGDSGSPFFVRSGDGTTVFIRGMNIASNSTTGYAEKWSRISSRLGVTIAT